MGLEMLLRSIGQDIIADDSPQIQTTVNSKPQAHPTQRRHSVVPNNPNNPNKPLHNPNNPLTLSPSLDDSISLLTKGKSFTRFSLDTITNKLTAEDVFVFYQPNNPSDPVKRGGRIYWCELGCRDMADEK